MHVCVLTEGGEAEVRSVSEEPEDKDFWDGVTKPASTESSTPDSEVQPHLKHFYTLYYKPYALSHTFTLVDFLRGH